MQLYCGYVTALDGSNWGAVYFLFYNDLEKIVVPDIIGRKRQGPPRTAQVPILMNFFFPGPSGVPGQGSSIEWIMENESATNDSLVTTIMPVFSASNNSITPVTFTQALGYGHADGVTGDPMNGFTVLWSNAQGQLSNLASVNNSVSQTVSITYTGPP